jgi:hypothetical protein
VKRVTDIMSEISAASEEQSGGIEQVNQTITQIDDATQQNAALVEEAAAASVSLEEQTRLLSKALSVFKFAQNTTQSGTRKTADKSASGSVKQISASTVVAPVKSNRKLALDYKNGDWKEY